MPTLGNPSSTMEILKKYGFSIQKKYGQNFLIDGHILDKIVEQAGIDKEDFVLEVGPGIGTLTQYLAQAAFFVTAIEIDTHLIPILEETLQEYDNVKVLNQDILKADLTEVLHTYGAGHTIKVVANLPYYITTPIIMNLLQSEVFVDSITVMVQKEVADRMQAGSGTKDYGSLSLAVQYYAKAEQVIQVSANCFIPRPKVGSSVIRLTRYQTPPLKAKDESFLFQIIRSAFNQRRKTLANSLANAEALAVSKEQAVMAIEKLDLTPSIRGEALTLEQFCRLSDELM